MASNADFPFCQNLYITQRGLVLEGRRTEYVGRTVVSWILSEWSARRQQSQRTDFLFYKRKIARKTRRWIYHILLSFCVLDIALTER